MKNNLNQKICCENNLESKDTSSRSNLESKRFAVKTIWNKRYKFRKQSGTKRFTVEINGCSEIDHSLFQHCSKKRNRFEPTYAGFLLANHKKIQVQEAIWNQKIYFGKQSGIKRYKLRKQSRIKRFAVKTIWNQKDLLWKAIWNQKIQVQEAIWNQKIYCENNLESKDTSSGNNLEPKDLL
jgi:hypothetical protein